MHNLGWVKVPYCTVTALKYCTYFRLITLGLAPLLKHFPVDLSSSSSLRPLARMKDGNWVIDELFFFIYIPGSLPQWLENQ